MEILGICLNGCECRQVSYNHSKTMNLIHNRYGFQLSLWHGSLIVLGKGICLKAKGQHFENLVRCATGSFQ